MDLVNLNEGITFCQPKIIKVTDPACVHIELRLNEIRLMVVTVRLSYSELNYDFNLMRNESSRCTEHKNLSAEHECSISNAYIRRRDKWENGILQ